MMIVPVSFFIALALYYIKVFHFRSGPPGLPTHTTALSQQGPRKNIKIKWVQIISDVYTFMQLFEKNISDTGQ